MKNTFNELSEKIERITKANKGISTLEIAKVINKEYWDAEEYRTHTTNCEVHMIGSQIKSIYKSNEQWFARS